MGKKYTVIYTTGFQTGYHFNNIVCMTQIEVKKNETVRAILERDNIFMEQVTHIFKGHPKLEEVY